MSSIHTEVSGIPHTDSLRMPTRVLVSHADILSDPSDKTPETQVNHGELVDSLRVENGFTLVRTRGGDEGWMKSVYLSFHPCEATHIVSARVTAARHRPNFKSHRTSVHGFGERVRVNQMANGFADIGLNEWVPLDHLLPLSDIGSRYDWVGAAEQFLGTPYEWGGRCFEGVDCSGLISLALSPLGIYPPHSANKMAETLGEAERFAVYQRSDLVFWERHVGVMLDRDRLLHATVDSMAVVIERLDDVVRRRGSPPALVRRLSF